MLTLTDIATSKVRNYLKENPKYKDLHLRIFINGRICNELSFGFTFDSKNENDKIIHSNDISIAIDLETFSIIKDSTVDYIKNKNGEGFYIYNQKTQNKEKKCGCSYSCS